MKLKTNTFLMLILVCLGAISCASDDNGILRQDLDQAYIGAGAEQYFLAGVPNWANFSSIGQCKRSEPVRYVNFENLSKSFALSYEQMIQLQFMLNKKFSSYKFSTGRKEIFLKDEHFIFYNVQEQIAGGAREFNVPKFNRIHLIWIDELVKSKIGKAKLKKLMHSSVMEQGHPIFVSTCLSLIELEQFISKNGYTAMGTKGISHEMFTPYNSELKINYEFSIDFSLLLPNKELHLFAPSFPKEFKGIKTKILIN